MPAITSRRLGSTNGKWVHDMYEAQEDSGNVSNSKFGKRRARGRWLSEKASSRLRDDAQTNGKMQKNEVLVTNLRWNITAEDITELASAVEGFKSVKMYFDESGRFIGKCTIRFDTLEAALIATAKYNGRELDSQQMQWTLIPSSTTTSGKVSVFDRLGKRPEERLGPKVDDSNNIVQSNRHKPYGRTKPVRRGLRFRRDQSVKPADLDAEIEEYMKSGSSSMAVDDGKTGSQYSVGVGSSGIPKRSIVNYGEESVPVPIIM